MKAYTVLLITDLSRAWSNGWYYKAGFEKNGCRVEAVDPKLLGDGPKAVVELSKTLNPHIILHTKDELPAAVFQELRHYATVVQWYPDPVVPAWLLRYVESCDLFFTMSEGLLADFRKVNPQSFWLTQAFEPSHFTVKGISDADRKAFSTDVAFVGNLGSKEQYLPRREHLERVIREGFRLTWWGPPIPRKISTLPLLYGRLGRAYGGRFVWGEEYAKVVGLSKVFLAFDSRPELRKSMSARMYTAVGCGAFYLCRHVDGIEEVLAPDEEIVTFRTEDEMIDKIRYYLPKEDVRKKIAAAGQGRVLRDHTYEKRIGEMLTMIEGILK